MHSLDVVRMIVPSCGSHSSGLDMIGNNLAAVCKSLVANSAFAALLGYFAIEQLTHLGW